MPKGGRLQDGPLSFGGRAFSDTDSRTRLSEIHWLSHHGSGLLASSRVTALGRAARVPCPCSRPCDDDLRKPQHHADEMQGKKLQSGGVFFLRRSVVRIRRVGLGPPIMSRFVAASHQKRPTSNDELQAQNTFKHS